MHYVNVSILGVINNKPTMEPVKKNNLNLDFF